MTIVAAASHRRSGPARKRGLAGTSMLLSLTLATHSLRTSGQIVGANHSSVGGRHPNIMSSRLWT